MRKLTKDGELDQIRPKTEEHFSYVLEGSEYIPLTYGSTQPLDRLKEYLEVRLGMIASKQSLDISELRNHSDYRTIARSQFPVTLEEISESIGWDIEKIRAQFRAKYRGELEEVGLIQSALRKVALGRPILEINLSDLGIDYVSRIGRYST